MKSHDRTVFIDRKIEIVISEIENNFSCALRPETLARLVNLSPSRLRHLFKSQTGEAPIRYLKSRRMQESAVLLRTTTLRVKEIMNRVGITDGSNFVHEFEKEFDVPPTMYRRLHAQFNSGHGHSTD